MKGRKDLVKRILSIVLVSVILLSAGIVNPVSCALTGTVTADAAAKTRVVVLDPGHGGLLRYAGEGAQPEDREILPGRAE